MPSRLLTVYLFAVILVSGVWIGTPALFPLTWIAALAIGAASQTLRFRLPLPVGAPVRATPRDAFLTLAVSAPAFLYLAATWRQEFPYLGDQWLHNACALEAFAFWWPWGWLAAVASITFAGWRLRRNDESAGALIALAVLVAIGLAMPQALSFAGRYPGTLHFVSVPLRVLVPAASPLDVERLLNVLAIPIWLLVLRPIIVRRRVDAGAMAMAALLFWQKDDIYYFTSGYLEPWAIVLLLTAAEHLVQFGAEAVWRPMLLIGLAAMIKEQLILGLPIVALFYFPIRWSRRAQLEHLLVAAVGMTPFALFWRARPLFKVWGVAAPVPSEALTTAHAALFLSRVTMQFGLALPVLLAALMLLLFFAIRRRAFAVLLLIALADFIVIYFAKILQPWAGYPRLNLVPLAMAAVALGAATRLVSRRNPAAGLVIVAFVAGANLVGLVPALRQAVGDDSSRSFIEHFDAPLFFPIRQTLADGERKGLIAPGSRVDVVTNGKRIFQFFWAGPLEDQYPDLAHRFRLRSASFTGLSSRCRCADPGVATLAVFIQFTNLGSHVPERAATEAEAGQCAAELRRTCTRATEIESEGRSTGLLGVK